jgi:hypothetical protein
MRGSNCGIAAWRKRNTGSPTIPLLYLKKGGMARDFIVILPASAFL